MSEHFGISGKVKFYHLPYDEPGSLCWCQFCKKTIDRMGINLHEGFMHGWIEVRCGRCDRTVWTASFAEWGEKTGQIQVAKLDKKCRVCGKKCGEHNCCCITFGSGIKGQAFLCSEKCHTKFDKRLEKKHESKT